MTFDLHHHHQAVRNVPVIVDHQDSQWLWTLHRYMFPSFLNSKFARTMNRNARVCIEPAPADVRLCPIVCKAGHASSRAPGGADDRKTFVPQTAPEAPMLDVLFRINRLRVHLS